jgi:uncharacterized protein (DUF3820 family)
MDVLTVNFGKYRGKQIAEIWEVDQQYAKWLYPQEILIGEYPEIKKFLDEKFRGSDLSFVMTWGKYKQSRSVQWIFDNDKSYFKWLIKNEFVNTNCSKLKDELIKLTSEKIYMADHLDDTHA